jgi:hypothetical protein
MIDQSHALAITQQAKALGISRGSVYYLPKPVPAADLAVMRRMDELHHSPSRAAACCETSSITKGSRSVAAMLRR